jgi:hypothetical protein
MIYELRTYTLLPGKKEAVVAAHEKVYPIYQRNGIKIIGFWTTVIGRAETFYYMLEYESLADRDAKRAKFFQDPELKKLMEQSAAEPTIQFQDNTILQPTPYSPLR